MLSERILDVAANMFTTYGLKAVSMDDIAKSVGISKRTLYENYSSKDELLSQCMRKQQDQAKSKFSEIINDSQNDFVDIIVKILYMMIERARAANPIFYQDIQKFNFRSAYNEHERSIEESITGFIALLEQGVREGYIRKNIDLRMTSEIILNQGNSLRMLPLFGKYKSDDILANVFLISFRGIATRRGIERIDELTEQGKNPLLKSIK